MKLVAVLIENRYNPKQIIERHEPFLQGFDMLHLKPDIRSLNGYNDYMTSLDFWRNVKNYDKVLIFQHDSEILREGIEDFLHFDYIGSPWKWQEHGGNGGLSLRDVHKSIETITDIPYSRSMGYEDVYYSNHMCGKINNKREGLQFSVETIFSLGSWGAHAIDKWLTKEQCKKLRKQYH